MSLSSLIISTHRFKVFFSACNSSSQPPYLSGNSLEKYKLKHLRAIFFYFNIVFHYKRLLQLWQPAFRNGRINMFIVVVLVKVFQRNITNRRLISISIEEIYYGSCLMWLWRPQCPTVYHPKAGELRNMVVQFGLSPETWEPGSWCLRAGEVGCPSQRWASSPFLCLFVLSRPSTDWMNTCLIGGDSLLYSVYWFKR